MNVSAWSIRNPTPSILLFLLLTLVGVMGFRAMKIQQFPDIDLPTVTVNASLPGASPAQMETDVARKLEDSIATVQGVKHIYTIVQPPSPANQTALRGRDAGPGDARHLLQLVAEHIVQHEAASQLLADVVEVPKDARQHLASRQDVLAVDP